MSPNKRLYLLLSLCVVAAIALFTFGLGQGDAPPRQPAAHRDTDIQVRFVDEAGVIPSLVTPSYDRELDAIYREMGVDLRFLLVKSVGAESLEQYAVDRMRAMGVGADVGERGILCVYDVQDQRMRIEVGPKLEGVLTDAFTGYLERQNLKAYTSTGKIGRGMQINLMLITMRLRGAALGMDYDPRPAEYIANKRLLAEGAGATASMAVGAPGDDMANAPATPDAVQRYSPQPTVAEAYDRYLDWLAQPSMYVDVPLFTPETRRYLEHYTISQAYHDYILLAEYGKSYRIEEQGDLAMLVYTGTPFESPWYFRRTPAGWVMDMMAAIRNSRELLGMTYTWSWFNSNDEYSKAFGDQVIQLDGVWRIQGGDNRALPVHMRLGAD